MSCPRPAAVLTEPVTTPCSDRLWADERARFVDRGYLAFTGLLDDDTVTQIRSAMSRAVRRLCHEVRRGDQAVQAPAPDAPANYSGDSVRRDGDGFLVAFEPGIDPRRDDIDTLDRSYRKLRWFMDEDPVFSELAGHPKLQGILEDLLGPESILFQDMALSKPAEIGSAKPWHQDNAYFNFAPLDAIVGCWIPIDDATVENGCMHVIPGGHHEGPRRHVHARDCEIPERQLAIEDAVALPMAAGDVLFFTGMLPHYTPPNRSGRRRRAIQLHFRGADTRPLDADAYDEVFASADGPGSCAAAGRR